MEDYKAEQEMEVEALQAILMDDIEELEDAKAGGLETDARCFEITVSPMGDNEDEPTEIPVRLGLVFAHTPNYPDELPLLNVRSLQGIKASDAEELKAKLQEEAKENLGMAMIYTLATSAKDWLREKYNPDNGPEEEQKEAEEEVVEAHGLPVTPETFYDWREQFEAELALERARLMPEAVLAAANKEKRMGGRQWFESGRGLKGAKDFVEEEEEGDDDGEDLDFDAEDDEDIDEDDMLEHYLGKGQTS